MAQQQIFLHGFDFWTLAGNVLGAYPEDLVTTPYSVCPLLVHRDDVDCEFPPFSSLVCFQDVDLDSWEKKGGQEQSFTSQEDKTYNLAITLSAPIVVTRQEIL